MHAGSGSAGTVLITGAASGIGRATAVLLAQEGWRCVLWDHDADRLESLLRELQTRHPLAHLGSVVDLTQPADIQRLAQDLPALDAVINNAGMSNPGLSALAPLEEPPAATLVALNLLAPARVIQACEPRLQRHARIVNVTSGAALRAIPERGLYSPSKAGLLAQTRALARARPSWTVTSLSPGFVKTELVQQLMDSGKLHTDQALTKIPLGRLAEPWEMAHALCFLATRSPRELSGQSLVVCGGSSVYGGSQPLAAAQYAVLPPDCPLNLQVAVALPQAWQSLKPALASDSTNDSAVVYQGYMDGSTLLADAGQVLQTAQAAARHFFHKASGPASLTLVLPSRQQGWEHAGDLAATRMLVSTLAVEWGQQGRRINAVEVTDGVSPGACVPLLRYLAGPAAQYLTGQTIRLSHNSVETHP